MKTFSYSHKVLHCTKSKRISNQSLRSPGHRFNTKHDDAIRWKPLPRYWPFVWGIYRSPVNSPHSDQWRGALMFSLACVLIPHPVASEHRWLVKAPRRIHSVPDVSARWSWRRDCHARLWNLHDVTNTSRLSVCKHCFSALPIDKTSSVEAEIGLLWRSFSSSSYRVWD